MSASPIELHYDVGSPYSYLAAHRVGSLVERTGRPVVWRAPLLGGVFKLAGNTVPAAFWGHERIDPLVDVLAGTI